MSDDLTPVPGHELPAAAPPRRRRRPRDWRYWVGGTGRVLMTVGVLMFGFVAYQLWGTGIEYRQSQDSLGRQFEARQASLATSTTTPATVPATTATTEPTPDTSVPGTSVATSPWPEIHLGDVIAVIEIPRIGKTVYAVAGVRTEDLKRGLGHYPDSVLPGQLGNAAFAGHRTTYGGPLYDIDQLRAGDEIVVRTLTGIRYVYRMVGAAQVVSPRDYSVITDVDPTKAWLTLTSCHPRYTAKQRIVVHAQLDVASAPPQEPTPYYGRMAFPTDTGTDGATPDPGDLTSDPDLAEFAEASELQTGWFRDGHAWPQVALWGLVAAAVAVAGWLLARRTRWWVGPLAAALPLLVALYFFYQNVNRLLPPDL